MAAPVYSRQIFFKHVPTTAMFIPTADIVYPLGDIIRLTCAGMFDICIWATSPSGSFIAHVGGEERHVSYCSIQSPRVASRYHQFAYLKVGSPMII